MPVNSYHSPKRHRSTLCIHLYYQNSTRLEDDIVPFFTGDADIFSQAPLTMEHAVVAILTSAAAREVVGVVVAAVAAS